MYRSIELKPASDGLELPHGRSVAGALARTLDHAAAVLEQWRRVSRSRRELATLDEVQLKDFGLSKSQALFESGKTFLQR